MSPAEVLDRLLQHESVPGRHCGRQRLVHVQLGEHAAKQIAMFVHILDDRVERRVDLARTACRERL